MHDREITLPELGMVAGTRAMLGAGLGLLLAGWLSDDQRRGAGWALFFAGAVTAIPLAIEILGKRSSADERFQRAGAIGRQTQLS